MKNPEMTIGEARAEIERLAFDLPGFISCTVVWPKPVDEGFTKGLVRPVSTKEGEGYQLTLTGGRSARTENFGRAKARATLSQMLDNASEAHVATTHVDFHLRVTRKGHVLVSRSKPLERAAADTAHDHVKDYPLSHIDSRLLLRALGFADSQDRLLPSMQAKFRQVNEFLHAIDAVLPETLPAGRPFRVVDAGCGKAYLSFAAQAYISQTRHVEVSLVGVDLRQDIVDSCRAAAARLAPAEPAATKPAEPAHASGCSFVAADIASYKTDTPPDMVLSLHACDTATDDALARAIRWGARYILSVPCYQHEIQKTLPSDGPNQALMRHGILRERLSDILADAFRAALLRIAGYRVKVIEFVDPEATGRNIMIRAERGVRPGAGTAVAEYEAMRDFWRVTPVLESRIPDLLPEITPRRPAAVPAAPAPAAPASPAAK